METLEHRCAAVAIFVLHGKEILIYVFPEKELRGLSHNFHIHVSVSHLHIHTNGPPIFLQQNCQTDRDRSQKHECRNWGLWPRNSFPGNICFEFSVLCLCSVGSDTTEIINTNMPKLYVNSYCLQTA
jgi:hypothetical protein